ncbi:hypothetical protein [Microbacterium lacticum]|uniref:hypothetical protein n=1 Tax=Microbacterium lacticum TaxID=33885 RepID=UPI001F5AC431|nr:hypothetical protein [Microbacterium lacticum]
MALVTITYNAWDHNRQVVPAGLHPRVGFRPLSTRITSGLVTDREVWGSLDPVTGAGSVQLESVEGVLYVPFMDWLTDPDQETEVSLNRARGYCEWDPVFPGQGGPIKDLPPFVRLGGVWYGLGAPPSMLLARDDVIYLDITGPGVGVWAPQGAAFVEGVTV